MGQAKALAARQRRTLTSVVEEAIRRLLHDSSQPERRGRVDLPISGARADPSRVSTSTTPRPCSTGWTTPVLLVDVNVLVYAYRSDTNDHERYRDSLTSVVNGESSFGYADLVLSGFVRVVTHPRAFVQPDRVEDALAFADALRGARRPYVSPPGRRTGRSLAACVGRLAQRATWCPTRSSPLWPSSRAASG